MKHIYNLKFYKILIKSLDKKFNFLLCRYRNIVEIEYCRLNRRHSAIVQKTKICAS